MTGHFAFDVLIIGSGAAGLSLALRLAEHAKVAVLAKGPLSEGSTNYAQGGVSAVFDAADSIESHIQDTLIAGADLCHEGAVRFTVEHGPASIRWLSEQGVPFTLEARDDGSREYHLTREGGHSHRRVVHAADATGRAIQTTLEERARACPTLRLFENHVAVDLVTTRKLGLTDNRCVGAYVLDRDSGRIEVIAARFVILASGGASRVYLYSSNPDGSTGDGIAMAWRAGCRIANMEFMQFHPTCLYHPAAKSFLITEAVRGEGGHLLLPDGTRFMERFDPRLELAPRDIVARAIDHEMKRLGVPCLYLDISHKPAAFIEEHFPNVLATCLDYGFDMRREPLPIVPAAHYTCGGVMTDFAGHTDLPGLYAVGEVAFTGLHGANRMASNSLLECLVFAASAGQDILTRLADVPPPPPLPDWDESRVTDSDEEVVVSHNWLELRRFMWDYVGIVRTDKRLARARHRVELLLREIDEYYGHFRISADVIELRNLAQVAELIIRCALARQESRGLHYTLDYPETDTAHPPRDTVLVPGNWALAERMPGW
ncbi:L-aspartate oxidase [Plasticicumulans sp.]|uniref:L-aspartate oxidase n=1 Tax=Plasticicumulans sp. TaxID=2307179 RepID=UPI002C0D5CF2|nr:L-aspartate oxidase [Plasticicumulans sp.]MBS0601220.1 L-aspartate oxidase [Pseudomonadota bacterium]HMV38700.1 L-aspartate oxidase [Plasticicumulans sp.]HMW40946.1 L-aspartate oxidase [Plasticicumulans sp.]HMZ09541.1 L-aspartate oxidase [Plasticicumulans sp.]HNB89017.1 L-aspartate oxidase [Plasticicumulans sp.]